MRQSSESRRNSTETNGVYIQVEPKALRILSALPLIDPLSISRFSIVGDVVSNRAVTRLGYVTRVVSLLLSLGCLWPTSAKASKVPDTPKPFLISVDQPAFLGEPIWVSERTRPTPYSYSWGECSRLELLYQGKPVSPWPVKPVVTGGGFVGSRDIVKELASGCFHTALYNPSPGKRLPLHIWFQIQQPGRYALRWNYEWPELDKNGKPVTKQVSSTWITFTVQPPSAANRDKWLRQLLAHPAGSSVDLLGDYIPSLVAAAPDERALHAIAARLSSFDQLAGMAAEALELFPEDRVRAAIFDLIQKQGPTDFLAHLVSWNAFGLNADPNRRAQMTITCFRYLHSSDPEKVAATIEMILYNVHGKDPTPTDSKLVTRADNEILNAAADIAGTGRENPQRELILYMRCIKTPEERGRLVSMARSESPASDIANTALIFDHAPEANGPLLLEVKERRGAPHEFKTAISYGLTITNLTANPVAIEHSISVERRTPNGWKPDTGIQAVSTCKDQRYNTRSLTSLAAHSSTSVYPWDGFVCGGQCEQPCMQNAFSGPGIFRFAVILASDGKRISSLPFAIPKP
jgi:hypothetical protein